MPQVERVDPPYAQVVYHISEQIASGELAPGDRLPGERDLRVSWDISKATANKVVARLKSAGLVETVVGSGTVVSDQSVASGGGPRDMWARIKTTGKMRLQSERSVRTIDWVDSGSAPDRKSTRLNSSHVSISYAVFCLKKKKMKYLLA